MVDAIPDGTLDVLVVKIHTDEGLTGIGEVTSQSYVCKACFDAPRSAARRHGLTSILVGEDPRDVEGLSEKMYYETKRNGRRSARGRPTAQRSSIRTIRATSPPRWRMIAGRS